MTTPADELPGDDEGGRLPRHVGDDPDEPPAPTAVSAHRCTPDRTVFTEDGNSDGWIASDLTVEPER